MASDAAELLLEGIDKLVDKHFEKTWDKTAEIKRKRNDKTKGSSGDRGAPRRSTDRYSNTQPQRSSPPRDSRSSGRHDDSKYSPTPRHSGDSDRRLGSTEQGLAKTSSRGSRNESAYTGADYDSRQASSRRYSSADRDRGYRSPPPRRSSSLRSSQEYERDRARRKDRRSRDEHGSKHRSPPQPGTDRPRYPDDRDFRPSGDRSRLEDVPRYPQPYRYSRGATQRP